MTTNISPSEPIEPGSGPLSNKVSKNIPSKVSKDTPSKEVKIAQHVSHILAQNLVHRETVNPPPAITSFGAITMGQHTAETSDINIIGPWMLGYVPLLALGWVADKKSHLDDKGSGGSHATTATLPGVFNKLLGGDFIPVPPPAGSGLAKASDNYFVEKLNHFQQNRPLPDAQAVSLHASCLALAGKRDLEIELSYISHSLEASEEQRKRLSSVCARSPLHRSLFEGELAGAEQAVAVWQARKEELEHKIEQCNRAIEEHFAVLEGYTSKSAPVAAVAPAIPQPLPRRAATARLDQLRAVVSELAMSNEQAVMEIFQEAREQELALQAKVAALQALGNKKRAELSAKEQAAKKAEVHAFSQLQALEELAQNDSGVANNYQQAYHRVNGAQKSLSELLMQLEELGARSTASATPDEGQAQYKDQLLQIAGKMKVIDLSQYTEHFLQSLDKRQANQAAIHNQVLLVHNTHRQAAAAFSEVEQGAKELHENEKELEVTIDDLIAWSELAELAETRLIQNHIESTQQELDQADGNFNGANQRAISITTILEATTEGQKAPMSPIERNALNQQRREAEESAAKAAAEKKSYQDKLERFQQALQNAIANHTEQTNILREELGQNQQKQQHAEAKIAQAAQTKAAYLMH